MGKKDGAKKAEEVEEKAALVSNAAAPPKKEEEDEDTPVIKALKVIDDKYCDAEVAMEKEIEILRKQFAARQAPLLEERTKILSDESEAKDEDKTKGTPACPEFWAKAMDHAGQIQEVMFECDEQVFRYIKDIKSSLIDADCEKKGYRVEFIFAENPFFTNTSLWLEAHYDYDFATARPWKEPDCIELKACTIEWKAGKNITVAKKQDAPAKKGKKKAGKAKEEPCPSFFRAMFSSCSKTDDGPPDVSCIYEAMAAMGGEMPEDEDEMLEMHLESVGQVCNFIHSELVPYAVRFYTGEACEDDDDDEESEEESGDEDEEEDSDEEPPPQKKGGKKSPELKPKAAPGKKGGGEGADGQKAEECKQQ